MPHNLFNGLLLQTRWIGCPVEVPLARSCTKKSSCDVESNMHTGNLGTKTTNLVKKLSLVVCNRECSSKVTRIRSLDLTQLILEAYCSADRWFGIL